MNFVISGSFAIPAPEFSFIAMIDLAQEQMTAVRAIPLLICSIGNPGPKYISTLHSAGHIVANELRSTLNYHPFKPYKNGEIAEPDADIAYDWTIWKSGKYMNESGPAVKKVWEEWKRSGEDRKAFGKLVILHDELEKELGKSSIRDGAASAKGHNGMKSIQQSFAGRIDCQRIAIGIGRPESRDPNVVANYVLRKMTSREQDAMIKVTRSVQLDLKKISDGRG